MRFQKPPKGGAPTDRQAGDPSAAGASPTEDPRVTAAREEFARMRVEMERSMALLARRKAAAERAAAGLPPEPEPEPAVAPRVDPKPTRAPAVKPDTVRQAAAEGGALSPGRPLIHRLLASAAALVLVLVFAALRWGGFATPAPSGPSSAPAETAQRAVEPIAEPAAAPSAVRVVDRAAMARDPSVSAGPAANDPTPEAVETTPPEPEPRPVEAAVSPQSQEPTAPEAPRPEDAIVEAASTDAESVEADVADTARAAADDAIVEDAPVETPITEARAQDVAEEATPVATAAEAARDDAPAESNAAPVDEAEASPDAVEEPATDDAASDAAGEDAVDPDGSAIPAPAADAPADDEATAAEDAPAEPEAEPTPVEPSPPVTAAADEVADVVEEVAVEDDGVIGAAQISEAQQLLTAMGYGPDDVTGAIGPRTAIALEDFAAQFALSDQTLTPETLAAIRDAAEAEHAALQSRNNPGLARVNAIRVAQGLLGDMGYAPGRADGSAGALTVAAAEDFAEATGAVFDGFDPAFVTVLEDAYEGGHLALVARNDPDAARRSVVLAAQRLLAQMGYDAGPADGEIGPRTEDAAAAFTVDRDLEALSWTPEFVAALRTAAEEGHRADAER